jgi:dipeptidase D
MTEIDEAGNLMAKIQPSKGFEKEPIIILQAHADMVAVKSATSNHNFDNNPIVPLYKNGYLYAKETNLGADNASGVAIIMALATDKSYRHGPLEIIITTQEEIGLIGAKNINSNFIRGQYLINFDSSNKNITIGCNGAVQIDAKLKLKKIQIPSHKVIMSIKLFDLLGGHSAQQAKFNHLNAFKGMGYILFNLKSCFDLNLINFLSSSIEMQIPTSCCAFIAIDKRDVLKIKAKINIIYKQLKEIYRVENHIQLSVNMVKKTDAQMIATSDSMAIINLIYTLPDGQQTFNILYQKTECSSNIESIYLTNQNCRIAIKCRALFESQKFQLCNQIAQIIKSSNGEVDISNNTKG